MAEWGQRILDEKVQKFFLASVQKCRAALCRTILHCQKNCAANKTISNDEDFCSPFTPNMLITGRNISNPPSNIAIIDEDPHARKRLIEVLRWYHFMNQGSFTDDNQEIG